jgi:hypothetical protein
VTNTIVCLTISCQQPARKCCVIGLQAQLQVQQPTSWHCVHASQDGTVQPPPVLEEGALLLQDKKRWWPFGNPPEGGGKFERGS